MAKTFADFQKELDQIGRAFTSNNQPNLGPNSGYYLVIKMEEGDIIADQYDWNSALQQSGVPMDPYYHQNDFHVPQYDLEKSLPKKGILSKIAQKILSPEFQMPGFFG